MSNSSAKKILAVILLALLPILVITGVLLARAYTNLSEPPYERVSRLPAWIQDFFPDRSAPPERLWLDSPFAVYRENESTPFDTLLEAFEYANNSGGTTYIYTGRLRVWDNGELPAAARTSPAPLIMQRPELDRGCGVVSLAMLLNFHGIPVDKMTLANQIHTIPYPGDPNEGFVGNIFTFDEDGLGVYHAPIFNMLREYKPQTAIDLTGLPLEVMLYYVANNSPVWIVTHFAHRRVTDFMPWQLCGGCVGICRINCDDIREVQVSFSMHSVLVTGFSETHIYFNDPLYNPYRPHYPPTFYRAPIAAFTEAWEQFGNQMVAVLPFAPTP